MITRNESRASWRATGFFVACVLALLTVGVGAAYGLILLLNVDTTMFGIAVAVALVFTAYAFAQPVMGDLSNHALRVRNIDSIATPPVVAVIMVGFYVTLTREMVANLPADWLQAPDHSPYGLLGCLMVCCGCLTLLVSLNINRHNDWRRVFRPVTMAQLTQDGGYSTRI